MKDRYERAECFLPWNLAKNVFNSTIFPYWSHDALYYFQETLLGKSLLCVDFDTGKKEKILDFQKLLNAISEHLGYKVDSSQLPLNIFSIKENPLRLCFSFQLKQWSYDLQCKSLIKVENDISLALISPDKKWNLWIKDYNLILTNLMTNQEYQLTSDGRPYYDYASSPESNTKTISERLENIISPPIALWSYDSSKLITHQLDQRMVPSLFLLQNAPKGIYRPKLHRYKVAFAGDQNLPIVQLMIVDVASKKIISLDTQEVLAPYLTPLEYQWVWWGRDNKTVFFIFETRASKELLLCAADANSGKTKVLLKESAETYVETSPHFPWPRQVIILEDSNEIIWLSERNGFPHLYLYDIGNHIPKQVITQGKWCVREVHFYNSRNDWVYFTACGYYKNNDAYHKQLFRCHLDGSNIECLTKESANHSIYISANKNFFLQTYSNINTTPISKLKKINGDFFCHIETADIKSLNDLKWNAPIRFCLMARDGKTSLYGNLYLPTYFNKNKKYPIIDHIYPGPQFYRTPTHFNLYGAIFRSAWIAQALSELGFIVIHIDGLGTPGRSKAFHDFTYQKMGDCSIPDHVSIINQLGEKYSFIDIEKVGVTGYSGGAYATVRAMLTYPHFFKVGVAAGGNYDLRSYHSSYGEKYNGLNTETYAEQSNAVYADQLEGKLLLIHGELDDNVHPCGMLQLIEAFIRYNKDFDMLLMPNQNHKSTFDHPYYIRKMWDYFVQHLLGETPPKNYNIKSMPSEFPQIMDW